MDGAGEYVEVAEEESQPVRGEEAYPYGEGAGAYGDGEGYAEYGAGDEYASGAAAVECTSSMVLCSAAVAARRWAGAAVQGVGAGQGEPNGLTWSSALLALSIASSISRSPSPLVRYAPRISRNVGGGAW